MIAHHELSYHQYHDLVQEIYFQEKNTKQKNRFD